MAVGLYTSARNDACDSIVDLVDQSGGKGILGIYTANLGLKLAQLEFSSLGGDAFTDAVLGTCSANTMDNETSAITNGTAGSFLFQTSAGSNVLSGTITSTGGNGDMILDTTSILQGDMININFLVVTVPEK